MRAALTGGVNGNWSVPDFDRLRRWASYASKDPASPTRERRAALADGRIAGQTAIRCALAHNCSAVA
jgi:hypothetical protein